jgi:hypothetical protein
MGTRTAWVARMADAVCRSCGRSLGLRRFLGTGVCGECSKNEKAERAAALAEYEATSRAVADPRSDPATIGANLPAIATRAALTPDAARELKWNALLAAFEQTLTDELVTAAEEERITQVAYALGFSESDLTEAIRLYGEQIFIARVNDGRLPTVADPQLILKRGEVAHLETPAEMLKEVAIREYKGGSHGVSFRIMKGVSYRVGQHRGQMEVVGSRLEIADTGTLVVTSQRVVFTGTRRSQEVRYDKLLNLNVYADGIQFHVSNRQTPSLFKVSSGPMVAAAVNAAAQD